MKLLTVDTIEEARQKLLNNTSHWKLPQEKPEIPCAFGRIIAEDLYSPLDIPGFRRSTVDGYAVIAADTTGAGESIPALLKLTGTVEMGKPAGFCLRRGECAYVPTGGMMPEGADAMVMIEYSEPFGSEIAIYQSAAAGSYVIQAAEDAKQGGLLLRCGTKIRSQEIGALAAAGITNVPVYAPLRLCIISSGDELVSPSAVPRPGEVRDINTYALEALAKESGYLVTKTKIVKDEEDALEAAVLEGMKNNQLVVLSGGSSQGEKDMTANVFSSVAKPGVFTHGLAIKPGKPTILAYDKVSDTILAGLPGHPVSALMVFRVLFSWFIRQLTGEKEPFPVPAAINCNLAGSPGRTTYQPVILRDFDNTYLAEPVFGKAGVINTLTNADGYIVIDMNKEGIMKGDKVQVFIW